MPTTRTKPRKRSTWGTSQRTQRGWADTTSDPGDRVAYTLRGLNTLAGDAIIQLSQNAQILAGSPAVWQWRLNANGLQFSDYEEDEDALAFYHDGDLVATWSAAWTPGDDRGLTELLSRSKSITGYTDLAILATAGLSPAYTTTLHLLADTDGLTQHGVNLTITSAHTTTPLDIVLGHNGAAAAGFGLGLQFRASTNTTNNVDLARILATRPVATHATRTARLQLLLEDAAAEREALRAETDGAQALLGFYGAAAAAKPTIAGAKGGNVALANLLTALAGLGLLVDTTT